MTGRGFPGWMLYLLAALGIFCVFVDYQFGRVMYRWADDILIYNQLLAVQNGNILLNHWVLGVDNFYLTELPIYGFLSLILGDPLDLLETAPLVVFILIILAAFGLVWQSVPAGRGRLLGCYIVLFLLALADNPGTRWFLRSAIHNGSILFALLAMNLIAAALSASRFNRLLLIPFFLIGFAASASDPFFVIFYLGPLLVFIVLRAAVMRKIRFDEAALFLTALAAALAGMEFIAALADHHGFMTMKIFSSDFVESFSAFARNFWALLAALQQLFSASQQTIGVGFLAHVFALLRLPVLAGIALSVAGIVWSIWQRRAVSVMTQFLLFASFCLFVTEMVSEAFAFFSSGTDGFPQNAVRFVEPIAIFVTVAIAIECPGWLLDRPVSGLRRAIIGYLGVMCCLQLAVAGLFAEKAMKSPAYIERFPLSAVLVPWLEQQRFTFGVGDYWTTAWIGGVSHLKVQATPVYSDHGTVRANHWLCDDTALEGGRKPQFAVMPDTRNDFGLTIANLSAAYGKPLRVQDIAGYVVLVFASP